MNLGDSHSLCLVSPARSLDSSVRQRLTILALHQRTLPESLSWGGHGAVESRTLDDRSSQTRRLPLA
jgi:hypothetical protein